jgi:hypothetical protein
MKDTWLIHLKRYPMMQVEDFIKMTHQSMFGPAHLMSKPTKERLMSYFREEIKHYKLYEPTPLVESIGNNYYRVSVEVVRLNLMTEEDYIDAFYESMLTSPVVTPKLQDWMKALLEELSVWIQEHTKLLKQDIQPLMDFYIKSGFPAMHHSTKFQELYHPHYRVIHQNDLGGLEKKIEFK